MKRVILISGLVVITTSCLAQTECAKSYPLFKADNYGTPTEVYTLGSNPQFAFLKNLKTPQQVVNAMKKAGDKRGAMALNDMLKDIGFANGVEDVSASAISTDYIPGGTIGNMGDGNFGTSYIKLAPEKTKAWKITSAAGCYVYVLAKCGNAFYPTKLPKATVSLDVPLNLNSLSKEIKVEAGETRTTTKATYVYYHKNKYRSRALAPEHSDLRDDRAATPVLLNTTKKVEAIPQTYRVTVNQQDASVRVYEDQPLQVAANINVERTSEYTGYYTYKTNNDYKQITRRAYAKAHRKMHHALRKEAKVAAVTGVDVTTDVPVTE